MKLMREDRWKRRGISLLWDSAALADLAAPHEIISMRQLFALVRHWPENLPSNQGNALVVTGLETNLDLLSPADAEEWLSNDLRSVMLAFQSEYSSDAALVFWLPTGRERVRMNRASETYTWICAAPHREQHLDLGRILWAGAEADAARIIAPAHPNPDADGPAWLGLHHQRLS
ncbi:hypothetical protein [Candidatus Oscillochloris fontis]|uniref:hypothetical protein n=1 Tax=Candidatus Oscillochloris fontis TaxID=2496868 RepID=UPI00101BDA43|nr:hypothetical protein [Candidatus Oscillochloris fontis]